jgi:hypothetical protein
MVTISIMDDEAADGSAPSDSNPPSDVLVVEPIIEEPDSANVGDDKGEKQTSDAAVRPTESAESLVKEVVPEDAPMEERKKSVVLKAPLQEEKKKSDGGKRHRKALSSVVPVIPAALDQVADAGTDRIRLGICAMDKKARSKPMAEILSRLDEKLFKVVFFGDQVILHSPVEEWPICDVLIAFHSKGYPLDKAKEYVELRKPFILNDLEMQETIKDRRKIYDLLEASGIDVPRHVFLSRDGYVSTGTGGGNGANEQEVTEFDDHIEVNGVVVHKPVRLEMM